MESGDSSHSLLSRRQSEMGSHYVVESGVFMSSFTATILIAALVTMGVLMLTLLITISVMLESCQSSRSVVLEDFKNSNGHDYCSLFVLHAELNTLEVGEFPVICKLHALQYMKRRYLKDFNTSLWIAEDYFSRLTPDDDGLDIILLDADDILSLTANISRISSLDWHNHFEDLKHQAHMLLVRLHMQLRASGWSLILFTRKPAKNLDISGSTLTSSGYVGWSSLIKRSDDEIEMENWEYLSHRRLHLQNQGFRIAGVISCQLDAFRGPYSGKRSFKLVNLLYYGMEEHANWA